MDVGKSLKPVRCPLESIISPHCLVPMCGSTADARVSRMERSKEADWLSGSSSALRRQGDGRGEGGDFTPRFPRLWGVVQLGAEGKCYRGRGSKVGVVAWDRQWWVMGMMRNNKGTPLGRRCRCMRGEDKWAQGWRGLWGRGWGTRGFAASWRLAPNLSSKVSMVACRPFGWSRGRHCHPQCGAASRVVPLWVWHRGRCSPILSHFLDLEGGRR